jgi:hypothetical protein
MEEELKARMEALTQVGAQVGRRHKRCFEEHHFPYLYLFNIIIMIKKEMKIL